MSKENELQDIVLEDEVVEAEVIEDDAVETEEEEKPAKKVILSKEEKAQKKFDKKIDKLKKENEKLEREKNNYIGFLQKERAEFDNFRKRKQAEVSSSFQNGVFDTVLKMLPVIDNFDLALNNIPEDKQDDDFIVGIKNLSKMFLDTLETMGVVEIKAEGEPFNHDFHDAMMQIDKEEGEDADIVRQVVQKGYKKDDKVIRYAKVIVTK